MYWKEIYNKESTDHKIQTIILELWADFDASKWNPKTESPLLTITYKDFKTILEWPVCKLPTIQLVRLMCGHGKICNCRIFKQGTHKNLIVTSNYFQRFPDKKYNSKFLGGSTEDKTNNIDYDNFTIEHCKQIAIDLLKEKLNNILKQI